MKDIITISPKPSVTPGLNYEFLRKQGISYIEKLASKIWTDYNSHDPGITMHELFSYAITDITYRSSFDIKDILAEDTITESKNLKDFFSAREILPNAPVTLNDYRKIIIDIDEIKNAWLIPADKGEVPLFFNEARASLGFSKKAKRDTPVNLRGLYNVLIEFDEHSELGDLNDNSFKKEFFFSDNKSCPDELKGLSISLDVNFPYWDQPGINWENHEDIFSAIISVDIRVLQQPEEVTVSFKITDDKFITVSVVDKTKLDNPSFPELEDYVYSRIEAYIKGDTSRDRKNLIYNYLKKIRIINNTLPKIWDALHNNRNLCEDFMGLSSLKVEEIAICGDIEIKADAWPEDILSQIYQAIDAYLAPEIQFYTLDQMLDKGKDVEEIFEGPMLQNGFIDDDELVNAGRREVIYVSDLINILSDIEGIVSIRNIHLANFPDANDSTVQRKDVEWVMQVAVNQNYVPRLAMDKSKLIFYKNQVPFIPNKDIVEEHLLELKKIGDIAPEKKEWDLDIPRGVNRNLSEFTQTRHNLPKTYGVFDDELPNRSPEKRKAQSKQLKGFLLFFDQILSNYIAQLANTRKLFALNSDDQKTYFEYELNENPDLFVGGKSKYIKGLKEIIESKETAIDRKNRFLDHLLARFSEQFTDYALTMYSLDGEKSRENLINDKVQFLSQYPEVSSKRFTAFNYINENVWNTTNISGLEKRMSCLSGIDNLIRKTLTIPEFILKQNKAEEWYFRFKDNEGNALLISEQYTTKHNAEIGIDSCKRNGKDSENYFIEKVNKGYRYHIKATNGEIVGSSKTHTDKATTEKYLLKTINYIKENIEGYHLVEHILLRPKMKVNTQNNIGFLPVSYNGCIQKSNTDPYSFQISIVLPGWTERFSDINFRNFFERTIRVEAPAHILLKVCWVGKENMKSFENDYKAWLTELAKAPQNLQELFKKAAALIDTMGELRNIYPNATLHDCSDSAGSNPVSLDNTTLGEYHEHNETNE